MAHVKWEDVATELIYGSWGNERLSLKDAIQDAGYPELQIAVLIDIAKSLRLLRCQSVRNIPDLLRDIQRNTKRRKSRKPVTK